LKYKVSETQLNIISQNANITVYWQTQTMIYQHVYAYSCVLGLKTGSVYHFLKLKSLKNVPENLLYYHTHYPYLKHMGAVGEYLDTHPQRVILLIRNPLDAGLSEYVR